jgi:hypothetical protein
MGARAEGKAAETIPLAVVVVNYRTPRLAIAAARSVLGELAELGGRCLIVDNGSGDESPAVLGEFAAQCDGLVQFVAAPRNNGFAAGCNVGIDAAAAEHYVLLNSDAQAESGALKALIAAAEAHPGAGVVAPQILGRDGRPESSRFRRHSILSEFVDGAHSGPVTRLIPHAEVPIAPDDWDAAPDWVSFAAVLLTRTALEAAGPIDEGYFLYFEDCDYCLRLKKQGFSIALAPDAQFRHLGGGSTGLAEAGAGYARLPRYYYRARSRFYRRWYGPLGPIAANIAWLSGRALAHLRGVFGRPAPRVAQARGRDIWIGWRGR